MRLGLDELKPALGPLERCLQMEVVLREPLDEEVEEIRGWVKERAAI